MGYASKLAAAKAPSVKVEADAELLAPAKMHRLLLSGKSDGSVTWLYGCLEGEAQHAHPSQRPVGAKCGGCRRCVQGGRGVNNFVLI